MSHTSVGRVIDALLTDEDLRSRFAHNRIDTVGELCLRGFELTGDEIDLCCQMDIHAWFPLDELTGERPHPIRAIRHCVKTHVPCTRTHGRAARSLAKAQSERHHVCH